MALVAMTNTGTQAQTQLETISVQEFMQKYGFVQVVKMVRTNTNNYPYITFIDSSNKSENIYFSVNAAKLVAEGQEIVKGFFSPFRAALTKNQAGEERWKIVAQGDGLRTSVEDLF